MRRPKPTKKQQKTALKSKLSSTKQQLAAVRGQLAATKRSEEAILAELAGLQSQLGETRWKLAQVHERLERTRHDQQRVTGLLARSERELTRAQQHLSERMAANYRQGPVRYASVLLGSHTMGELVSRTQLIRSIVKYESTLIAQIKAGRERVLKWKALLETKALEIFQQEQELAGQQATETKLLIKQRDVLQEVKTKRAQIEAEYAQLAADSEAILQRLRVLEQVPVVRGFTGKLAPPVAGAIVSRFGPRFHPILKINRLHAGVDFGGSTGTPIYAAAAGVVAFAGTMRGYGNVVVLNHGEGLSTLYAHCSALLVRDGDQVEQGKQIARVGATGLATGPHLHFEVRRHGTPVNPVSVGL